MSFVNICQKIDRVITTPHCIWCHVTLAHLMGYRGLPCNNNASPHTRHPTCTSVNCLTQRGKVTDICVSVQGHRWFRWWLIIYCLTHRGKVMDICVSVQGHRWFRWWLIIYCLTHRGKVMDICVSVQGHRWFRWWLIIYCLTHRGKVTDICVSVKGHRWLRWWLIIYWNIRNFNETWIKMHQFSFKEMSFKM